MEEERKTKHGILAFLATITLLGVEKMLWAIPGAGQLIAAVLTVVQLTIAPAVMFYVILEKWLKK